MFIGMHTGLQGPAGGGAPATPVDEYYDNVVSLRHFDGNLTDQKGRTWTAAGDAAATGAAKYGTNGLALDRTDDKITTPTSADFGFGTGDFTIELWVYPDYDSLGAAFMTMVDIGGYATGVLLRLANPIGTSNDGIYVAGIPQTFNFWSSQVPNQQWSYIALQRASGVISLYVGANRLRQWTQATDLGSTNNCVIGQSQHTAVDGFKTVIDEVRITKGVARYDGGATITPPTLAFPDA